MAGIKRHSRQFTGRAVGHLVRDAGIGQFQDVGSELPTADNTHEIAQRTAPEARIVYADNDPLSPPGRPGLRRSPPPGQPGAAVPYTPRTPHEVERYFEGLHLLPPGVVSCPRWRPESTAEGLPEVAVYGGAARKP